MPIRCGIRWLGASPEHPCQLLSLTYAAHTSATAVAAPSLGSFARCRRSPSSTPRCPQSHLCLRKCAFACACPPTPTHVRPAPSSAQSLHAEPDDVRTFQTAATGLQVRVFRSDADQLSHVDGANRKTRTAEFRFSLLFKGPFARDGQERWKRRDRYSLIPRSRDLNLSYELRASIKRSRDESPTGVVVVGTNSFSPLLPLQPAPPAFSAGRRPEAFSTFDNV